MSPSGGLITTVEPCMTWSPVKSIFVSSSRKHRWFDACPGVWMARSVTPPSYRRSPCSSTRSGAKRRILSGRRRPPEHLRAGGLLEQRRGRRVVGVRVGAQDPADAAFRLRQDSSRCGRRSPGPGSITASASCPTMYVLVPGPVITPGIRRDEARDVAVELLRDARDEVVGRLAGFLRIAPVDLEVRRVGAAEQLRPFAPVRPAGAVDLDVLQRARRTRSAARGSAKRREVLQRCPASRDHFDLAPLAARERFLRRGSRRGARFRLRRARPPGPPGASATKKRVSKRRGRPGAVIQCA